MSDVYAIHRVGRRNADRDSIVRAARSHGRSTGIAGDGEDRLARFHLSFSGSIAVDGDWLLATGSRYTDENRTEIDYSAWLYQRQSNGTWTLVRRLVQYIYPTDFDEPPMKLDMQGGVAAIVQEYNSWIFERSGTNWVSVPSPIQTDGMDVAVNGGTILATQGYCAWAATAYRKGTNGAWQDGAIHRAAAG